MRAIAVVLGGAVIAAGAAVIDPGPAAAACAPPRRPRPSRTDSAQTVDKNLAWLSAFYDAMRPFTIPQAYQNFVDRP